PGAPDRRGPRAVVPVGRGGGLRRAVRHPRARRARLHQLVLERRGLPQRLLLPPGRRPRLLLPAGSRDVRDLRRRERPARDRERDSLGGEGLAVNPVALGYVGCGFMAQKVHLPNIVGLDEVNLLAIAEPRSDILASVARRSSVDRVYAPHHDLAADPAIEAVMISGHYSGQGEIAIDCLKAGKHVLVEKPMATSLEQADRILAAEAGNEAGARLMVAY